MGRRTRRLAILLSCSLIFGSVTLAVIDPPTPKNIQTQRQKSAFAIAMGNEPATVNPIFGGKDGANEIQQWVVETLFTRNETTGEWDPVLAESWSVDDSGQSFTVRLRDHATWSDGTPVTVEDVKFSFDRIFDSHYPITSQRLNFGGFDQVEILNSREVRFHAKEKHFSNLATLSQLQILPKQVYGQVELAKSNRDLLVGSGPYLFEGRLPGQSFNLKKNPNWWGHRETAFANYYRFPEISYRITSDDYVALEMFRKGELDFFQMSVDTYLKSTETLGSNNDNYRIQRVQHRMPGSVTAIAWNLELPLFQQKEVRKALALLLDRKMMQQKFYAGLGSVARGPWSWTSDYADPNVPVLDYNPEEAAALLASHGWKDTDGDQILDKVINGQKVSLSFSILTGDPNLERILTIYQQDAKPYGVDIQIRFMGWNPISKLVKERKFEALDTFIHGGSLEIDPRSRWHSSSAVPDGINFAYFKDPEVDRLIEQAEKTLDSEKRKPLLQKVYKLIADEMPYLFIFNESDRFYAYSSRVHFEKPYLKYGVGLKSWWLEESLSR